MEDEGISKWELLLIVVVLGLALGASGVLG